MKFQARKIVTLMVVAALSLSIAGLVAADPGPCDPTRASAEISCDPCSPGSISAQSSCPTPIPPEPCTPDKIASMGADPCDTPIVPVPVDPCINVDTPFPFKVATMACETPTEESVVEATPAPENLDVTVTFNDTDLGVTLLKSVDADGNVQMDVFHTDTGTTTTTYLFSITQADLAPYANPLPAENTLLASAEGVAVYVLTTGEIQVNAGPDAEGKIHVKIFNGIPWTNVYGYTIDPQ